MKNIVVFSLWGDNPMYWEGAKENIKLIRNIYIDFIPRFYVDENIAEDKINYLIGEGCEVIKNKNLSYNYSPNDQRFLHNGIFWRFLALKDQDVNIVLSRDCDSRINRRESIAVQEWIESDKDFHIMRDHPYHQVPILAGMWGARNGILRNIDQLLGVWNNYPRKGIYQAEDQDFLGQIVYPIISQTAMEHSEFGIKYFNPINSFKTERENFEFVGDVFDENNNRHPDYWKILNRS